jgi:hypothetical protein
VLVTVESNSVLTSFIVTLKDSRQQRINSGTKSPDALKNEMLTHFILQDWLNIVLTCVTFTPSEVLPEVFRYDTMRAEAFQTGSR